MARGTSWCFFLSLVGIGLSAYLGYLHIGLLRGELLGGPLCSASGALNCHAVTAGAWGSFLGLPLALWGLLGYVAVFALSLLAWQSAEWAAHALTLIALLVTLFVGVDAVLLFLMIAVIRFYCVLCLLTYAVNLALLLAVSRSLEVPWPAALRQTGAAAAALLPSGRRPAAALFWGILLVGLAGVVGVHAATTFVSLGSMGNLQQQLREFVAKQPRVNVDVTNDPSLGPANAPLHLVEFSDFFCPSCQRASQMNIIFLAGHRKDARLTFKHFPLDTSCNSSIGRMVHPGACQVAAAAACAHLQGRFWAFHDRIFEKGHAYRLGDLEGDARRVGLDMPRFQACLASGQGLEAVKRDIEQAAKLGISSTPTYVVNGMLMAGGITPAVFEALAGVLREKR